jgi:hypothetical protein
MTEATNATPTENQDDAAAAPAAPAAPKAAAKGKAKVLRLRSLVGTFTILHTNTVIGEGEEKKVEIDAWVQLQIDAKKLEIVTD